MEVDMVGEALQQYSKSMKLQALRLWSFSRGPTWLDYVTFDLYGKAICSSSMKPQLQLQKKLNTLYYA